MLSQVEIDERRSFYANIFGKERILAAPIFPPAFWPVSNYDGKIRGLSERGFKNPQKMIMSFPSILGLSFASIDEKIRGLTERGLKDPQKMITSFPSILSKAG